MKDEAFRIVLAGIDARFAGRAYEGRGTPYGVPRRMQAPGYSTRTSSSYQYPSASVRYQRISEAVIRSMLTDLRPPES